MTHSGWGVLGLGAHPIAEVWFVPCPWLCQSKSLPKDKRRSHLEPCRSWERARKHWDMNSWVTANTKPIWWDDRQVQIRNKTVLSGSSVYVQIVFKTEIIRHQVITKDLTKFPKVLVLDILFIPYHGNIFFTTVIYYSVPHILTFTMCINQKTGQIFRLPAWLQVPW